MPRAGPRSVRRYSDEFKLTAVRLSQQPGIQVKTVAAALEIHPFMLSKGRKDARNGLLRGKALPAPPAGPNQHERSLSSKRWCGNTRSCKEHDLLKKASRFCSARKATSSPERATTRSRTGCCQRRLSGSSPFTASDTAVHESTTLCSLALEPGVSLASCFRTQFAVDQECQRKWSKIPSHACRLTIHSSRRRFAAQQT